MMMMMMNEPAVSQTQILNFLAEIFYSDSTPLSQSRMNFQPWLMIHESSTTLV